MLSRRVLATALITALIDAPFAIAVQGPSVATPILCAAPGVNNRVTTHLSAPLKSPRVYFKATGPEYYVDMHQGVGDEWWILLPAVDAATRAFTYRVAAQDANGNWVSGTAMTINTSATCPVNTMSDADKVAADNIVLGLTTPDQSPVPIGFSCKGIKTIIASNGQMRPAEECRVARAAGIVPATGAGGAAAPGTIGASGFSTPMIAALAIVGGGIAGYAYGKNKNNNKNVSPSRP
jgi:hypothetical protein